MSEIFIFPGDYRPGAPTTWPSELATTEGYEQHQNEVHQWLETVSNEKVSRTEIDKLRRFAFQYGFEELMDGEAYEDKVQRTLAEDPTQSAVELQKEHIGFVIASPLLSVFQKGDLLTMSAQALFNGQHPANGRLVVLRELGMWRRMVQKRISGAKQPIDPEAVADLEEHFQSIEIVADDGIPSMTGREFYKHAASKESGEPVTNVLKALGILLATSEQSSFKQTQQRVARQIRRDKRAVDYWESRKIKDYQRLNRSLTQVAEARIRLGKRIHRD